MQDMFCFQCQETVGNKGCTRVGVCGKKPEVANAQDLLIWVTKGLSVVTTRLREEGVEIPAEVNHQVTGNLFTTITNANFDKEMIYARVRETIALRDQLLKDHPLEDLPEIATFEAADDATFDKKAEVVGVLNTEDEDIRSLRAHHLWSQGPLLVSSTPMSWGTMTKKSMLSSKQLWSRH